MRRLIILLAILIVALGIWNAFSKYISIPNIKSPREGAEVKIVTEESVTVNTVKKVGPSVVTVVKEALSPSGQSYNFGPFSIFGLPQQNNAAPQPQDIGSGFIVSSDGLVITSKHVVSDVGAKFQIVIGNDKKYDVQKIYRDPLNDVAILKIDPSQNPGQNLAPVVLGDSSNLQVGQFVIAIGTALGQFRSTVTTGVISGLGRGITAGSEFAGFVERLDNVIQTDAAINPGNSGGPLLNSSSQVIGVNTAVSSEGQNIGFALPINIIKDSLKTFNQNGQFNRPYLGVAYKMLSKDVALSNDVPAGAYIQGVVNLSPASKAGLARGDIITKIDGVDLGQDKAELSNLIAKHKVGDTVSITFWRNNKTTDVKLTLDSAPNQ